MSELETIQTALKRAARRRRFEQAWHGFWKGGFIGSIVWLVAVITYKLAPIPFTTLYVADGIAILIPIAGLLIGWFKTSSLQQTARWVDLRQQFQERLSTALELANEDSNENWRSLLVSDAARFASQLNLRKLVPIKLPHICQWVLLILALGVGLGFVPEYRSKEFKEKKLDAVVIKDAGKKLAELTKQNMERHPTILEPTRKALESVEQTGLKFAQTSVNRTDALKDLAKVTDQLKQNLNAAQNPVLKQMQRAAKTENGSQTVPNSDLQKKIRELEKSLGKATDSKALDKLKNDMQKAQKMASGMPSDNSPAAAEARKNLAEALANMQQQAKEMGQQMPDLNAAIAALQANQVDSLVKDLNAATTDLEKLEKMSKELSKLQQQTKEGKDLPEQLKFGQAQAAQSSIQKMIDALKSSKLSNTELAKMMDEISRSVDPASPYGKAAEFLKASAGHLAKGDKADASAALAKASAELQKTMDQMNDAAAMMASLDALQKAEFAIATRDCWGECNNGNRPGFGKGMGKGMGKGRGGGGVGTWTDPNSSIYPEITERWDNSDVNRPDMQGKGLTDRGDMKLGGNIAPTKLHGQISPGSSMPSITLKGVNLKGQSSVEYQQATTAAQSAAQSALNQDEVPRAYQGAVRDYFDDLKK